MASEARTGEFIDWHTHLYLPEHRTGKD